jgi:hypothetical protein
LISPAPASRVKINQEVIELICGAVGEIAQIIILYPLDTIKVRSQQPPVTTQRT